MKIFQELTNFRYKRNLKQAFGFYLAYLVLLMLVAALFGGFLSLIVGNGTFEFGLRVGNMVAVLTSVGISILVLRDKGLLGRFRNIVLVLIAGVLAYFAGGLLGLILVAYFTTLVPVGDSEGYCTNCGHSIAPGVKYCPGCGKLIKTKSRRWITFVVVGVVLIIAIIVLIFATLRGKSIDNTTSSDSSEAGVEDIMKEFAGKELDLSGTPIASVVNVICPFAGKEMSFDTDGQSGSGVVLHSDGLVITNSHVIPQDGEDLNINEEGCIVLFPDAKTGFPMQAYLADPVVIPGLSDKYDLAMLVIKDVYRDKLGYLYGKYPNTFPAISDDGCKGEDIRLGEKVTVYGYPGATGGYSLTVTEGVVSSFSADGIAVSAKIDSGNSGGLATDENGCFMGVPTMVYIGEAESYGIIVPASDVEEFINELSKLVEEKQ